MELKSLAIKTGLVLDELVANIEEKENYIVVRTPDRPDYFWGNYLIMKDSPSSSCCEEWCRIFEKEIGTKKDKGYIAITCDLIDDANLDFSLFEKEGFDVSISKVLTTSEVKKPEKYNENVEVRAFGDADWPKYVDIHFTPNWGYGPDDEQKVFLQEESEIFKTVVKENKGQRYGAFLDGEMVAELGVYWKGDLVRFNNVGTHPEHRRLGACSTLVYKVSQLLLKEDSSRTLVMEADEDYHAAAIYESVGFKPTQKLVAFEWVDSNRFS
jgi:hypothetical protein